jgi:carbamoylphosphate synthase large subunit
MSKIILHRANLGAATCKGIEEHSKTGIKAVCTSGEIPVVEHLIRWGTTATIPGHPMVYNQARSIHQTADKGGFRAGLRNDLVPRTVRSVTNFLQAVEGGSRGPWIVRPTYHQRSENFHVCHQVDEVIRIAQSIPEMYISEVVDKVAEYRVFVCQGRVVWGVCLLRTVQVRPVARVAYSGTVQCCRRYGSHIVALRGCRCDVRP